MSENESEIFIPNILKCNVNQQHLKLSMLEFHFKTSNIRYYYNTFETQKIQ